ncbi:MAG: sigma-70 family RNA polymerase sigma factor [bacterium]|nr:sigma-70 family RNA polymerase sigma factor [bacterium]
MELCLEKKMYSPVIEEKTVEKKVEHGKGARLSDISDEAVVRLIKNGSEAAFAELTKRYMKKSYSFAYRIVGDMEAAKDLTQDIFVKIYSTIGGFKEGAKFFSWYYRILLNHCINYKRRKKLVSMLPFTDVFTREEYREKDENVIPDDEDYETKKDTVEYVRTAIDKLSSKHKAVIVLFDLEGIAQEQIAEILDVSVGTVRSRIHYARKQLKSLLIKHK